MDFLPLLRESAGFVDKKADIIRGNGYILFFHHH